MKIAFATDDGINISQHFGQARYFQVVEIEDRQEQSRDLRDKAHHQGHHAEEGTPAPHQHHHAEMLAAIHDCQMAVAGGMGSPMYQNLMNKGIRPMLTDIKTIDEAVSVYLQGMLTSRSDRVHQH